MKWIRCLSLFFVLLMCFASTDAGAQIINNKKFVIRNQKMLDAYCAYAYILDAEAAKITEDVPGLHVKGWVRVPSGQEVTIKYPSNDKLFLFCVTLADGLPWEPEKFNAPPTVRVRVPPDLREDSFKIVYEISNDIGAVQYSSVDEDDLVHKKLYKLKITKTAPQRVIIGSTKQINRQQVIDDSPGTSTLGDRNRPAPKPRPLPKTDPFNGNYERKGQDYAVLFATDIYEDKHAWDKLQHPVSDATKIKGALERYGFTVEPHPNPTLQDIGNVLVKWYNRTYAPDDQLLVYFAGHGHYDHIDGYLAATDSKGPDVDQSYKSYYPYQELKNRLNSIPCPNILLIVDACHSGNISPDVQNGLREKYRNDTAETRSLKETYRGPDRQRRIKERVNAKTRWFLTSGGNEEVPDDSVFTKAFLKALDDTLGNESGNDKVLTIQEIESTFHKMLAEEKKPYSPETGAFGDNKDDKGFLFIAPSF